MDEVAHILGLLDIHVKIFICHYLARFRLCGMLRPPVHSQGFINSQRHRILYKNINENSF